MRTSTHLSDDRLIEVCFDAVPTPAEDRHFDTCDRCSARRSRLQHLLREVSDAASAEVDQRFPSARLATQQSRILHRIEQEGRPARVIAFPAAQGSEVRPLRTRPAARWIAGAAAAGLAVGMLAGHLVHDLPGARQPRRSAIRTPVNSLAQPALRAVGLSDEEFLGQVEHALNGPDLAVLRPFDDLTPR
jgi:anti-sigma factor RsiW